MAKAKVMFDGPTSEDGESECHLKDVKSCEEEEGRGGLAISGTIIGRSKRDFTQEDGSIRTCVTYRILGGIDLYFVDDWGHSTAMSIGSKVDDVPVFAKAYAGKNQQPQVRLSFLDERSSF